MKKKTKSRRHVNVDGFIVPLPTPYLYIGRPPIVKFQ